MPVSPIPHVSRALQHLRPGVTAVGSVLALALIAHALAWCMVHFTGVRTTDLGDAGGGATHPAAVTVVESGGAAAGDRTIRLRGETPETAGLGAGGAGAAAAAGAAGAAGGGDAVAPDPNVVAGTGDITLRRAVAVIQTVGVLSSIAFVVLLVQGVVVAGGGAVPGVEMAVGASTWSLACVLLALPWPSVLPEMAFSGVFVGPSALVAASGSAGAALHVGLPLVLAAGVAAGVIRFRMGVERGVIVTHASQLDEKLEREMRGRRVSELGTSRAAGALNQAIGLGADEGPAPEMPAAGGVGAGISGGSGVSGGSGGSGGGAGGGSMTKRRVRHAALEDDGPGMGARRPI